MTHCRLGIRKHLPEVFNPHKRLGSHGGAPCPLPEANLMNRVDAGLRPSLFSLLFPNSQEARHRHRSPCIAPFLQPTVPPPCLSLAAFADACVPPSTSGTQGLFQKKKGHKLGLEEWKGFCVAFCPLSFCLQLDSVFCVNVDSPSAWTIHCVGRWQWGWLSWPSTVAN